MSAAGELGRRRVRFHVSGRHDPVAENAYRDRAAVARHCCLTPVLVSLGELLRAVVGCRRIKALALLSEKRPSGAQILLSQLAAMPALIFGVPFVLLCGHFISKADPKIAVG